MKILPNYLVIMAISLCCIGEAKAQDAKDADKKGWISLFNGKDFEGWQVGENATTFTIENGTIKVAGPRSHIYYTGPVGNHDFKNFEFKAKVMTKPGANSGIYIHTKYQEKGWPSQGYEIQVNNSQSDWRRTGSLYNIVDVKETYVTDEVWYTEYIKVEGKRIIIKINNIVVVDYTEPENAKRDEGQRNRLLSSGTFALQGHDPGSVIFYKDIMVRPLP